VLVKLRKSFTNYGPNKRRSCNWVVSHLWITEFYVKQTAPNILNSRSQSASMWAFCNYIWKRFQAKCQLNNHEDNW